MKDVQNQADSRGVEIQKVGIKGFEMPLVIQRKDAEDKVIYASATCGVTLPAHYKGTHMSRFVEVLNEWRSNNTLGVDIKGCVEAIIKRLDAKSGYLKFEFKYFVDKKAPVTEISAPMCYDCFFEGILDNYNEEDKQILLMVKVDGKDDLVLKIPCEIEKADGIYKVENGKVAMSSVGEWTMNDILLINQKTTNTNTS